MNNPLLKKTLPHLLAILIFLAVSVLFCKPILDGMVLNQHDNVGWKGMAQNSFEYKEKNGHFPLWNPNLFSGMPNYQVAMEGKSVLPDTVKLFSLGLPKPINFFFLACICFYILSLVLRINPIIGMMSSLAYAFSTYNVVILAAGHDTQMLATAFMPLLLAGLIAIYEKKYWLGFAITTYAAFQQVAANHLQVTYYFFLIAALITLFYLIKWIKEKDWKHIGIAGAISVVAAVIGLAGNALTLKTTSEYSKFTMRGGKDMNISDTAVTKANTSGLDTGYAFAYSLGKAEALTFIMPNAFGGYSGNRLNEGSRVAKKLIGKQVPEDNAEQVAQGMPSYWGMLSTSGPAYFGVIICLLGLIGFVMNKSPLRWGLLAATILGTFMAWGKYFAGFNTLLFEYLPLYNKFRSPAFAQVIPQLCVGISAAIGLQQLLFGPKLQKNDLKKIGIITGGLFAFLGLMYLMLDYNALYDASIRESINQQSGNTEIGSAVIAGLKEDRQSVFGGQLLRALGLALLGLGVLFFYYKNQIKGYVAAILLLVISTLDVYVISHSYFTNDREPYASYQRDEDKLFVAADSYQANNFSPTPADQQILQDKDPNYRVLNMLGTANADPFSESRTSYYHKSIGGYHPAKLRIYQDVLEKYFAGQTNPQILNMLNTRYIITQSPFTGRDTVIRREEAYGNCWFVKTVLLSDKIDLFKKIGTTNLRDTAWVEKDVAAGLVQPQPDSLSTIRMTKFDNDAIEYEADCKGPQFAVFSEIYYPKGWNAYVDDKKTTYYNTNYILRGLSLPAGKHTIRFVFEPESVKSGTNIMFIASILVLISLLGGLFMAWKKGEFKQSLPAIKKDN
ncbi:MAG: YfhO family protein [Bacteroidetes bacterium]|nr:YfhO family protein [Bacteroidota bacterium]